jgi:hypothetical protein
MELMSYKLRAFGIKAVVRRGRGKGNLERRRVQDGLLQPSPLACPRKYRRVRVIVRAGVSKGNGRVRGTRVMHGHILA